MLFLNWYAIWFVSLIYYKIVRSIPTPPNGKARPAGGGAFPRAAFAHVFYRLYHRTPRREKFLRKD